jgi:2-oxo-4-hydroxy-4-carboxy-5-ureidoimidazoline decarboxylase
MAGDLLQALNELDEHEAIALFRQCCNSRRWAGEMTSRRPFSGTDAILDAAREVFRSLTTGDWKEAFAGHPKIGDVTDLMKKFPTTADASSREQSGIRQTSGEILAALAAANEVYESRFGYIFIVCATGKNAGEMLHILNSRLRNNPDEELNIAEQEQEKITMLRLQKQFF